MKACLILGNGPSILTVPRDLLERLPSYGMNYAPFQPTYYICIDHNLLTHHAQEIRHLAAGARICYLAAKDEGTSDLYKLPYVRLIGRDQDAFAKEIFFTGLTATYVALKIAYYEGFGEVHLWGVDHSEGWEHYRPDYPLGDVDRREWRMRGMEYHYALAAAVYRAAGRRIVNHSRPSTLDRIFERGKEAFAETRSDLITSFGRSNQTGE